MNLMVFCLFVCFSTDIHKHLAQPSWVWRSFPVFFVFLTPPPPHTHIHPPPQPFNPNFAFLTRHRKKERTDRQGLRCRCTSNPSELLFRWSLLPPRGQYAELQLSSLLLQAVQRMCTDMRKWHFNRSVQRIFCSLLWLVLQAIASMRPTTSE